MLSPPGDAVAFAVAIRVLARNPAQRAAFGLAGRRHAESCLGMEPILQRFIGELALLTGVEMVAVDAAKVVEVVKKRA